MEMEIRNTSDYDQNHTPSILQNYCSKWYNIQNISHSKNCLRTQFVYVQFKNLFENFRQQYFTLLGTPDNPSELREIHGNDSAAHKTNSIELVFHGHYTLGICIAKINQ